MTNPLQQEMFDWLQERTRSFDLAVAYGSYARGHAYRSSDLDLLLIDDEFTEWTIHTNFFPDWPDEFQELHVITCSHRTFKLRYCTNDQMVSQITEDGFDFVSDFRFLDYVKNIDCEGLN